MKRKILIVLALLGTALNLLAQEHSAQAHDHSHEGRIFMGGAISFWNETKEGIVTFDFCPEFGYLFNDTWGVGMLLGYEWEKEKLAGGDHIVSTFKVSPFVRYYYHHKGPFNLYLDGGFGFNWGKDGATPFKGFEAGVRPGACIDLTEGLCLCLRMGFMGYRSGYSMGEEPGLGNNGFGFRFAPEELMIGLELEF